MLSGRGEWEGDGLGKVGSFSNDEPSVGIGPTTDSTRDGGSRWRKELAEDDDGKDQQRKPGDMEACLGRWTEEFFYSFRQGFIQ